MKIIFYALLLSLISHAPVYGKNASFTTASAINARNATHQFLLTAKNAYEIYNWKNWKMRYPRLTRVHHNARTSYLARETPIYCKEILIKHWTSTPE